MISQNKVIQNKGNKKMEEFKRHGEQSEVYIHRPKKRERKKEQKTKKEKENKNIFLTCECIHRGK